MALSAAAARRCCAHSGVPPDARPHTVFYHCPLPTSAAALLPAALLPAAVPCCSAVVFLVLMWLALRELGKRPYHEYRVQNLAARLALRTRVPTYIVFTANMVLTWCDQKERRGRQYCQY